MKNILLSVIILSTVCFANAQITNLLDFGSVQGSHPYGSLISDGTFLYGMTSGGGINNMGTVFKVKTDGTGYVDLFDFSGVNGQQPNGSLIYDGNYLYGMTTD